MQDTPTPIAEIDHDPSKLDQFLEKHQKSLMILAALLFLGIITYVFNLKYQEMKDQEAGSALSAATTEDEYRAVIENYGNRTAAGTAALAIADLRTTDKDAIEALQFFITTYKDHPNIPKAELQLALRQINSGKTGEANTTLDNLISRDANGYLVPMAKISLGDIAVKNNEIDKAKVLYTEAKNLNLDINAFANIAVSRLAFLNAKLPQLVTAPAPPAPTPAEPNSKNLPFGPDGEIQGVIPESSPIPDVTTPEAPAKQKTTEDPAQL